MRNYFLVLASLFSLPSDALANSLVGVVSVIDGDTIEIHGQRIRFEGIDAPESAQLCTDEGGHQWRCGQRAALALAERIGSRSDPMQASIPRAELVRGLGRIQSIVEKRNSMPILANALLTASKGGKLEIAATSPARLRAATGTAAPWRSAGSQTPTSTSGWFARVGRSPTAATRPTTSQRRIPRDRIG